ncbi:MAG: hypothetical protein ABSE46_07855 [Terracidiphilus sp.]
MKTSALSSSVAAVQTMPAPITTSDVFDASAVQWAWAGRGLKQLAAEKQYGLLLDHDRPAAGDAVVVQVERIGHHRHIETEWERRLRLYEGDRLVGIFGNRYATDVYEGRVLDLRKLHLLTTSGLIGTVTCRNREVGRPTTVMFLGYLADSHGRRINTKRIRLQPAPAQGRSPELVLVVGTGMSTGKTTVMRKILHAMATRGVRVAGCKLTGTASPRDLYEMKATGAVLATDFSDYGYPSTYGESLDDLIRVLDQMGLACGRAGAEIAMIEIADGLLQQETRMLLESDEVRRRVRGVVVAGSCSSSLLFATEYLQRVGHEVWAASGLITNSPLFVREFTDRSPIAVVSSRGSANRLAGIIVQKTVEKTVKRAEDSCEEKAAPQ